MNRYKILSKSTRTLSPWVKLSSKRVGPDQLECAGSQSEEFHSLVTDDYVNVLGISKTGEIPLVRQYRPAIERYSLELPGGHVEPGRNPAVCARSELFEETGFEVGGELSLLGCLDPDTGRLENRVWCFFADGIQRSSQASWQAEPDIELVMMEKAALYEAIKNGQFKHAMHVATLGLAMLNGYFTFD